MPERTTSERSAQAHASRYAFVHHLGRGGMGAVDLVYDDVREETVARKRCRFPDAAALSGLKREFRAAHELVHPSLVRVHELGVDAEGVYFTMEAIRGVDLRTFCRTRAPSPAELPTPVDRALDATLPTRREGDERQDDVARGALDPTRLATVLPSILEGLAHLHEHGLVHRDIKPSNVMVDERGCARILDFGILAELSRTTDVCGTPGYMAPEQLHGRATPASDLYALGVTLFELAIGDASLRRHAAPGRVRAPRDRAARSARARARHTSGARGRDPRASRQGPERAADAQRARARPAAGARCAGRRRAWRYADRRRAGRP